jgi:hypothetical protein
VVGRHRLPRRGPGAVDAMVEPSLAGTWGIQPPGTGLSSIRTVVRERALRCIRSQA